LLYLVNLWLLCPKEVWLQGPGGPAETQVRKGKAHTWYYHRAHLEAWNPVLFLVYQEKEQERNHSGDSGDKKKKAKKEIVSLSGEPHF
jgi:hypothetical protein